MYNNLLRYGGLGVRGAGLADVIRFAAVCVFAVGRCRRGSCFVELHADYDFGAFPNLAARLSPLSFPRFSSGILSSSAAR